jgi:predicted RNA binding protein YcfA (HicA-like mRNA interferase family)
LKTVSGKQFCRILERHGWQLRRIRGSHHVYTRPGIDLILTVPVHGNRDLKVGLLASLLKQAGLTEADL